MPKYIETLVGKEGDIIQIEIFEETISIVGGGDIVKASTLTEDLVEKAKSAFNKALNTIRIIASDIGTSVNKIENRPDKLEFSFALKIDADANAFIAKIGTEAQFEVKLTWELTQNTSHE